MNLWLCVGIEIHVLDKLFLTLDMKVVAIVAERRRLMNWRGKELAPDLDKLMWVFFQPCSFCETSFAGIDLGCERIHLACHLKDISNPKSKQ